MIFVTVGTQLPFPRLMEMIAELAHLSETNFFAQTADPEYTGPVAGTPFLPRDRFLESFEKARLVIGHAGMGTILTARRYAKPLIVVPRRRHLGEHRSDHQYDTASQLLANGFPGVAPDLETLESLLDKPPVLAATDVSPAKDRLIDRIGQLIR